MRSLVQQYLDNIHAECCADTSGAVASYIPQLAEADPEAFGICIVTSDGYTYSAGDVDLALTIQSISKPFTYALALHERGLDHVDARIDVEPSGDAFNEISIDPVTRIPRNAMINAGAIAAASMIPGATLEARFERMRECFSGLAGRALKLNQGVFDSEREAGHRNRAIGHMLREFGVLEEDPDAALDLYFRQCSIEVTCRDLAFMAMTLGNGGLHPVTEERVLDPQAIQRSLGVMSVCGMYDDAGAWTTRVGMPAKSGVAGGILAVLPGQLGIAVHSPRLDSHGHSVRGAQACRRLSEDLQLHFLEVARGSRSAVRARYRLDERRSDRERPDADNAILDEYGARVRVYELHGDLLFSAAESVVRRIADEGSERDYIVLEVSRVHEVADVSRTILADMHAALRDEGCVGVVVDPDGILPDPRADDPGRATPTFEVLNDALAWCEDRLVERYG